MQLGVDYSIKHSGQFLYKMSNEKDKKNYQIEKITLSDSLRLLAEKVEQIEESKL